MYDLKMIYYIILTGVFTVDPSTGIIYPSRSVTGGSTYQIHVSATDGVFTDTARVDVTVLSVNKHSPVFLEPPSDVRQLDIPEVRCLNDDKLY